MRTKLIFNTASIVGVLALLASPLAIGQIANTKHNLGSTGTGPNTTPATAEVCVFCHTPHGADTSAAVPLWNKAIVPATYSTYADLNTSSLDGTITTVGSVSIACLSCHDGTQAMDSVLNAPGSGANPGRIGGLTGTGVDANGLMSVGAGIALIGTDLRNDHPIGIQYGGGGITTATADSLALLADQDFKVPTRATINGNVVWWIDADSDSNREKNEMQLYTRTIGANPEPFVECASCHDPHTTTTTFLRVENTGSAVCLACHTK